MKREASGMYGILNHLGSIWTTQSFATRAEAEEYLRTHDLNKDGGLSKHRVVPVRVTIETVEPEQ